MEALEITMPCLQGAGRSERIAGKAGVNSIDSPSSQVLGTVLVVLCRPVYPAWQQACSPRPQGWLRADELLWGHLGSHRLRLHSLSSVFSDRRDLRCPNIFPGAGGRGAARERWEREQEFASGLSRLGGPVACQGAGQGHQHNYNMCVWHPAQGRNLKQFSTKSCCSCVQAPPSSEPNSFGSQGTLTGLERHRRQEGISSARVCVAVVKFTIKTQMCRNVTFLHFYYWTQVAEESSFYSVVKKR